MLTASLRIASKVWQHHYHVPEWTYWLAALAAGGCAAAALLTGFYSDLFDGKFFDRQFVGGITVAAVNLIMLVVAVVGIIRWHRDRRKARDGLVVPRFYEFAGAKGRGEDVRLAVLDALNQSLPAAARSRVHGIKVGVDLQHQAFAARLLRHLRADGVLHGRVVDRKDGGWTVHARLVRPAFTRIFHFDWHTYDLTSVRIPWRAWFSRLPSSFDVTDEEFPLELTRDLEALVRTTAATVGLTDTPGELEVALRDGLATNPDSTSPAMDLLRSQLALAIFAQDREDEALQLLRKRIGAGDAFGELLRMFAFLAGVRADQISAELSLSGEDNDLLDGDFDDDPDVAEEELDEEQRELLRQAEQLEEQADALFLRAYGVVEEGDSDNYEVEEQRLAQTAASLHEESLSALATAAQDETDPRRDVSLYNLINALLFRAAADQSENDVEQRRQEAWDKLDELRQRSAYYRKTWYVKRLCGLRAWARFEAFSREHRAHSPEGRRAAREAAKWYSRAIRSRPRVAVMRYEGSSLWRRYRLRSRRSPILEANTFDGHFYAGHPVRAWYYEKRFQRRRRALLRGAFRDLALGYLDLAQVQFDWVKVGRHNPKENSYDAVEAIAVAASSHVERLRRVPDVQEAATE